MKGSTISGTPLGEFRHIPTNPKTLGCLKDFIEAHSSKNAFIISSEQASEWKYLVRFTTLKYHHKYIQALDWYID